MISQGCSQSEDLYFLCIICCSLVQLSFENSPFKNNTTDISSGAPGSGQHASPSTTIIPTSPGQRQALTCDNITCREGFYCLELANGLLCNPSCHSWRQYPHATNVAIDFLVLLAVCVGVISGVGVLVIAGLRWKKV